MFLRLAGLNQELSNFHAAQLHYLERLRSAHSCLKHQVLFCFFSFCSCSVSLTPAGTKEEDLGSGTAQVEHLRGVGGALRGASDENLRRSLYGKVTKGSESRIDLRIEIFGIASQTQTCYRHCVYAEGTQTAK